MRLFSCQSCAQILFFENTRCERCFHAVGFHSDGMDLSALDVAPDSTGDTWTAIGRPGRTWRFCANATHGVCNWLVDASSGETMCEACRRNRVIPNLDGPDNRLAWRKIEAAKHRLFYTLFKLRLLPSIGLASAHEPLAFQFLEDLPGGTDKPVMTGHADGVITLALSEADDAEREQRRKTMGEPYRTLLGHFRHEVGHYFWDRLVRDGDRLEACRTLFGDDTMDYQDALRRHYLEGAPPDWQERYVSTYATAHPWEDFAETWAHYLHIVDTLEMARAFDLKLSPEVDRDGEFSVDYSADPYDTPEIGTLIDVWLPVSTALNSMTRTMGKDELYPFVLSPPVVVKLGFIHGMIRDAVRSAVSPP